MSTIWFDVTTIVHWRRPPVGVVRVEAECFKYFASTRDPRVRFCHFNKQSGTFHEISPDFVHSVLHAAQHPESAAQTPSVESLIPKPPERRFADATVQAVEQMPSLVRRPTMALGRKGMPVVRSAFSRLRQARSAAVNLGNRVSLWTNPGSEVVETQQPPATVFGAGDVYVSLGLDWDQKELVPLYRLKAALGLKVILFCYDLIPVLLPHLCVGEVSAIFARYFVDVAWCADRVFCISKASRKDLSALLADAHAPMPEMPVITLGSNLPQATGAASQHVKDLTSQKFILFVSTIERRKNHEVIYRAIARLVEQGRTDLPLIIFVGMPGWGVQDFLNDLSLDPRVKNKFQLLNHVSDADLAELYKKAYFTVYPSLYEGWGLPLAESLAYGKFSLASNSSSLPEVGGSLVEYIEPWETNRWAERIAHYLDHPEEVAKREAIVRAQYRVPTWKETGKTLFDGAVSLLEGEVVEVLRDDDSGQRALAVE